MTPSTSLPTVLRTLARLKKVGPVLANALPVRAVGFYAAIAAPLLYLPLLGGRGGLTSTEAPLFVALLLVNAGALVLGQGYGQEE